ncbi:DUF1214 domain-containing protein [Mycobacterium sp. IDR2000157661]|uniref:DUF1214 domain-containing protein n=1 Tax=Mycobacterium sp. IDR2000157661 TaxID=2867005 RepID=UPI001EED87A1|nr:DUF1214 domain-containing protein [Mycobacterium sp. IDR2000157661]
MTPGTYARFIGRIGALAVALGIGTAIANSPGLAAAEDGVPSDNTSSSAGATDTPGTGTTGTGTTGTGVSTGNTVTGGDDIDGPDVNEGITQGPDDDEEITEEPDGDIDESDDDETVAGEAGDELTGTDTGTDTGTGDAEPQWAPSTGGRSGDPDGGVATKPYEAGTTNTVASIDEATDPADSAEAAQPLLATQPIEGPMPSASLTATAPTNTPTVMRTVSAPALTPATVTTPINGFVSSVLNALGFGPRAATGPTAPPQPPLLWAMLGWARREVGNLASPPASVATAPVAALTAENPSAPTVSPLATSEQLAAERIAARTANSLPVVLMKLVLRHQFMAAARFLYGADGINGQNMAALDRAVDEYAMAAAFQQQLLDSMNPTVVTQVAPPHRWFGQNVPGSRILYDNPDTIYRFMGVNGASEYVITGRFHDTSEAGVPSDVTFSVLEGLAGTTSSLLSYDDLEINDDGTFTITVSREPANGRANHLQLTNGSTIIAARDTLGNWNSEVPMSLSIARVGGPPDSLFAQLGGFAFLGQFISGNPLLTSLVSLVPPLPYMPPVLRGVFTAAILVVRGANEQAKYMALATHDPETGARRPVNRVSQPSSNAEFLANQRQSNGHFQLADDQALVLRIDPGQAEHFVVPTYNIWTITDDYWNEPASLNTEQAVPNADGTYTVVISPTDPGAANWVSTSGLNQGTLSIRFQGLPGEVTDGPSIVDQQVMSHQELAGYLPAIPFVTPAERAAQLAARKEGFDNRWAPYPQL